MCTLRMREKEKLPGESSGQSLTSPQSSLLGFRSIISPKQQSLDAAKSLSTDCWKNWNETYFRSHRIVSSQQSLAPHCTLYQAVAGCQEAVRWTT